MHSCWAIPVEVFVSCGELPIIACGGLCAFRSVLYSTSFRFALIQERFHRPDLFVLFLFCLRLFSVKQSSL